LTEDLKKVCLERNFIIEQGHVFLKLTEDLKKVCLERNFIIEQGHVFFTLKLTEDVGFTCQREPNGIKRVSGADNQQ
jgi:hypothetical protein